MEIEIVIDMITFLVTLIIFESLPVCPILILLKKSQVDTVKSLGGIHFVTIQEWLSLFIKRDAACFRSLFLAKLGRFNYKEKALLGVYTLTDLKKI